MCGRSCKDAGIFWRHLAFVDRFAIVNLVGEIRELGMRRQIEHAPNTGDEIHCRQRRAVDQRNPSRRVERVRSDRRRRCAQLCAAPGTRSPN